MKFSIKDFFSKCDQIRRRLRIWSYLLKKCLVENFIFCTVMGTTSVSVRREHPKQKIDHFTLAKVRYFEQFHRN